MLRRLLVALVGMAMGGMVGLGAELMGLGNAAILLGAVLGGLIFSIVAPRAGRVP
jgi:hypothetical protein